MPNEQERINIWIEKLFEAAKKQNPKIMELYRFNGDHKNIIFSPKTDLPGVIVAGFIDNDAYNKDPDLYEEASEFFNSFFREVKI
jgi:hypothetical protein